MLLEVERVINVSRNTFITRVGYTTVCSGIYECNEIDDLTAGVGVSYDPLSHSRHNDEV